MRAPELEELAFADAGDAVRRYFDAVNYSRARFFWGIFLFISFAALIDGLDEGLALNIAAAGTSLVVLLALVPMRKSSALQASLGVVSLALLACQILLWSLLSRDQGLAIGFGVTLVPLVLLLFRLRASETWMLAAVAVGAHTLRFVTPQTVDSPEPVASFGGLAAVAIVGTIAAGLGSAITVRRRQEFLGRWQQAADRERDRARMRGELHDARAIQLAMLPDGPPTVSGLDLAGCCIPASEVGGDYFDYFPGADGTLTVAIGDVAGHGMASGLVLAGVRAGLHLLADEVDAAPERVLARLNGLVARPGGQRLLMTLGLAGFDPHRGRATWVAAGHPGPLCIPAASQRPGWVNPTTSHPPLGTKLPLKLELVERPLCPGDVWLLCTDGALEAPDHARRELGEEGLERLLRQQVSRDGHLAAAQGLPPTSPITAREILDGLLRDLEQRRGGRPPEDDLTLVVVRVTLAESAGDSGGAPG